MIEFARQRIAHGSAPLRAGSFSARGGRPLPAATRVRMESALGHDFGNVRVHSEGEARDLAASLGAAALAVGPDIAIGPGREDLESPSGRRLLAHELAHTVQQEGAASNGRPVPIVEDADAEADASRAAAAAESGGGVGVRRRLLRPAIQRQLETPFAGRIRSPVVEEFLTQETEAMSGLQGMPLTPLEIDLAGTVFADSIDYSRVRLLRTVGPLQFKTVGNVIRVPDYFTVDPAAASRPRPRSVEEMRHTFIHELTHVWQYQHGGTSYISYSLGPQIAAGLAGRGRNAAYCYDADAARSFWSFTPEQQGLIVENAFLMRESGRALLCDPKGQLGWETDPAVIGPLVPLHERYIAQMRAALPAPEAAIRMQRASEVMGVVPGAALAPVPPEHQLRQVKPLLEVRF